MRRWKLAHLPPDQLDTIDSFAAVGKLPDDRDRIAGNCVVVEVPDGDQDAAEDAFRRMVHNQTPGMLPAGSRVAKSVHEPGDIHPIGALATVIGSHATAPIAVRGVLRDGCYFIEWDDMPGTYVVCAAWKLRSVS